MAGAEKGTLGHKNEKKVPLSKRGRPCHVSLARIEISIFQGALALPFLCWEKKRKKRNPPSTRPSASLASGLPTAGPQTRPDRSGLRQVRTLVPHAPPALGVVEREKR